MAPLRSLSLPDLRCGAAWLGVMAVCAAILFSTQAAADQQGGAWSVRGWNSDNGLPADEDFDLVQGADGFIWVATSQGVFRFDGNSFVPLDVSNLTQQYNSNCYHLYTARDGGVWWAMDYGRVVRWREGQATVWGRPEGIPAYNTATSICEGGDGSVFAGFGLSNVAMIANGKVTILSGFAGVPPRSRCCVTADSDGNVWCVAANSLLEFRDGAFVRVCDASSADPYAMEPARKGGFWVEYRSANMIQRVAPGIGVAETIQIPATLGQLSAFREDNAGNLWVGTIRSPQCGLFRVEGGRFVPIGLQQRQITSICADREGNIWLTTLNDGIKQLRPSLIRLLKVDAGPSAWGRVCSFARDTAGEVWVVLENHTVFCQIGGQWKQLSQFGGNGKSGFGEAVSVEAAPDGSILVGTLSNGIFRCTGPASEPVAATVSPKISELLAMLLSRGGDLWVTANRGWIVRFRDGEGTKLANPDRISAPLLVEGVKGDILTAGNGHIGEGLLYRITGDTLAQMPFPQAGEFPIHGLCCDPDGSIWIGFLGGGLGRLKEGRFVRVVAKDGLPDDNIYQVLSDGLGHVWIISNSGLSRIDLADLDQFAGGAVKHLRTVTFAQEEKDLDSQISARRVGSFVGYCARVIGNELWFPYGNGILIVNPGAGPRDNLPPPVVVESMYVDGRNVPVDSSSPQGLKLPPSHSRIEFDYAALSFDSPENNQYRYMLEGYDKQWIEAGTGRQATYSRLTAGRYRFQVIACNSDGVWNQAGVGIVFTVNPFFWQTWWFQVAVLAAIILCVAVIVRFVSYRRLRWKLLFAQQEAAFEKERSRIARDIHDEVGASLTQIALMAELATTPESVAPVADSARRAVDALDGVVWAANPRKDTLASLMQYLVRFAEDFLKPRMTCRVDFPTHVPQRHLPPEFRHHVLLVVKEALNNALKYSGASEVRLGAVFSPESITITIADNGRGFETDVRPAQWQRPAKYERAGGGIERRVQDRGREWRRRPCDNDCAVAAIQQAIIG